MIYDDDDDDDDYDDDDDHHHEHHHDHDWPRAAPKEQRRERREPGNDRGQGHAGEEARPDCKQADGNLKAWRRTRQEETGRDWKSSDSVDAVLNSNDISVYI